MTFLTTILLGAGVLFLASGLDNSSLKNTFQKIISGQAIDWSGGSSGSGKPGDNTPAPVNNQCPDGYVYWQGKCLLKSQ